MPNPRLERVSTATPWPRGLVYVPSMHRIIALARGRPRRAGGPSSTINDRAGTLVLVDPDVFEYVDSSPGQASPHIVRNGVELAAPSSPPFRLWDTASTPPTADIETDRPYAGLSYDDVSKCFFMGCFSGIDIHPNRFRKNGNDAIHRYDLRTRDWGPIESHDASVIPLAERRSASYFDNKYFPHHDPSMNPPPHGYLNGIDGVSVSGEHLLAVAKDNHALVRFALDDIRTDPSFAAARSMPLFDGDAVRSAYPVYDGPAAVAVWNRRLFVGLRTTNVVVEFAMTANYEIPSPIPLVVARLPRAAELIDIAFRSNGDLFVSCSAARAIWNAGRPNSATPFDGARTPPFVTLPAKCANIAFGARDQLYISCNQNDDPAGSPDLAGVIYRVPT